MSTRTLCEIDIWTGVISPDRQGLSVSEANAILRWSFDEDAKRKMEELAARNNLDKLSDADREELEAHVHAGQVIAILQAKARLSLKHSGANNVG